jgi:PPK2 family polyphosphate:nucleotide phosphotransferase
MIQRYMDLETRFRVRPDHKLKLADHDTGEKAGLDKQSSEALRAKDLERLDGLQERLYAEGERSLLVVFQAMDAAGKDGTIEHVMSGVNPQGVRVTSFKQPTRTELAHDWLWRCQLALPARGEIGIFNRSHYEEVVAVRVHPEFLAAQAIDPAVAEKGAFWQERFDAITSWERHLHASGTRVVKFFLHLSKAEQRERFLARAEEADKNWKFSAGDVAERAHWDDYQRAFERALAATSTADAPWYVIPADHKWLMRTAVASILVHHLEDMDPQFPQPSEDEQAAIREAVAQLQAE